MTIDVNELASRGRRIAASDVRERAEGGRPSEPTPQVFLRWCHVRTIRSLDAYVVPVREFRAKRPFDGTYVYASESDDEALCLPGLKARHYRAYSYAGEQWSADATPRLLIRVGGAWYVDHQGLYMIGTDQLGTLIQDFGLTSCFPSPSLA